MEAVIAIEHLGFEIVFGLFVALAAWVFRLTWKEIEVNRTRIVELRLILQKLEVLVAGSYVTRAEFTSFCGTLFDKLDHIADKLERKLDK